MTTMTPEDGLKIGLASLFTSEEFSDFTIKCGPYEFKVHRAVICAQSEYFKAACRSNSFKEGDAKLITLDTSDMNDPASDDPEAVKKLIYYFYYLEYELDEAEDSEADRMVETSASATHTDVYGNPVKTAKVLGSGDALAHAKVFAAAVKYNVLPLRALATTKFRDALENDENNDASLPGFAKTITTVYSTTSEDVLELRNIVTDTLTSNKSLLSQEDIKSAVCSFSGLSFDLLRKVLEGSDSNKNCPHCGAGRQQSGKRCASCFNQVY